ncbi:MAG: glutaredoxin family protein [Agarilytica sp.]
MKYVIFLVFICFSQTSLAEIYKWTDEQGNVHYGDAKNRPENTKTEKVDIGINTYEATGVDNNSAKSEKVVMYSTSWCGYCKKARNYFLAKNIPFVEYDIEKDRNAKRRYDQIGGSGVPVILYKGGRINGFNPSSFDRLYRR